MMDKRTYFKSLARRFFYLNKRIFSFGNIGLLERRQTFYERQPKRCRFRLIEKMGLQNLENYGIVKWMKDRRVRWIRKSIILRQKKQRLSDIEKSRFRKEEIEFVRSDISGRILCLGHLLIRKFLNHLTNNSLGQIEMIANTNIICDENENKRVKLENSELNK